MKITVSHQSFALKNSFNISRGSKSRADVVTVRIERDGYVGWGECVPYARYGETIESVIAQIRSVEPPITRTALLRALEAGAARNAIDCALWDLEAKTAGTCVWNLARLSPPKPIATAYTISLGSSVAMAQAAAENAHRPILKLKLGNRDDLDRVIAVRNAAPKAQLVIDANEGWKPDEYHALITDLVQLNISLIEQPFAVGHDECLSTLDRPIPICADESVHTVTDLPHLVGKYDCINVKLDKTGGLTAALELRSAARALGFDIMIGCMVGTSLAMAPAILLTGDATLVDLDGPLLLSKDRDHPIKYDELGVHPASAALWG